MLGKITLTLKSPDGLHGSLQEYMSEWSDKIKENIKPHEDWEDEYFSIEDKVKKKLEKFVKYSEYVTVEIDLDNETASVVKHI